MSKKNRTRSMASPAIEFFNTRWLHALHANEGGCGGVSRESCGALYRSAMWALNEGNAARALLEMMALLTPVFI
jgi:hypothetical protein